MRGNREEVEKDKWQALQKKSNLSCNGSIEKDKDIDEHIQFFNTSKSIDNEIKTTISISASF